MWNQGDAHISVIFADTPFSPLKGIYIGLSIDKFKTDYRQMAMRVAAELKPDNLDLLTEPDTHAKPNTGSPDATLSFP